MNTETQVISLVGVLCAIIVFFTKKYMSPTNNSLLLPCFLSQSSWLRLASINLLISWGVLRSVQSAEAEAVTLPIRIAKAKLSFGLCTGFVWVLSCNSSLQQIISQIKLTRI